MATQIGICNMALRLLGSERITAITDENEPALILNDVYTMVLYEVLAAHPWNFAIKRDTLTELDDAPDWGYDNAFQLPADCLRVIRMNGDEDSDAEWVREADQILTDEETCEIQYIAIITDTSLYTPFFVTTLATRLASEIAFPITNSATASTEMYKLYLERLRTAKGVDAQEGSAIKQEEKTWEEARE